MMPSAWSAAIRALDERSGRMAAKTVDARAVVAFERARALGLVTLFRGDWKLTPMGQALCENRIRVNPVHPAGSTGVRFVATWIVRLTVVRHAREDTLRMIPDPIRKGQLYRLRSGALVRVTKVNGSNITCCYELPDGTPRLYLEPATLACRADEVDMRRDYFQRQAKLIDGAPGGFDNRSGLPTVD